MRNARITICLMAAVLVTVAGQGFGIEFNDGQIHTIDYVIGGSVTVSNEPFWGDSTTINLIPGGSLGNVVLNQDSILNNLGGSINELSISNSSRVTFQSGTINNQLWMSGDAYLEINGGTINTYYGYFPDNNCRVTLNEGVLNIIDGYLSFSGTSEMTMYGGTITGFLNGGDNAKMFVYGGSFEDSIHLNQSSIITLYGTNFYINGRPAPYGSYSGARTGTITGVLADGSELNHELYIYQTGTLILAPIPEPASLLLLGLGSLLIKKK